MASAYASPAAAVVGKATATGSPAGTLGTPGSGGAGGTAGATTPNGSELYVRIYFDDGSFATVAASATVQQACNVHYVFVG